MPELCTISPDGVGTLRMHAGQLKAWDSARRFVFVLAGTQGGKTSWGPWWLWREVQNTAHGAPGDNDYLAVTASYDLFKLKMMPALREVFEHNLRLGRYWASERVIELADPNTGKFLANTSDDRMWGRIILRSAAAGGGLESSTARGAWLDECGQDEFTAETWWAILRRLSIHGGRALGTTTPYNVGWLKSEIYDRWAAGDTNYDVVQYDSRMNPLFSDEEFERARATMPAWQFAMFYRGQFSRPAGMIYDCWDDKLHVVDDFDIPLHYPRYVGLDFGAVHQSSVWIAENPETSDLYVYRETLDGGKSTREHVAAAREASTRERVVGYWGGAPSEDQQRIDWGVEGIGVMRPPIADVEAGIARVYGALKPYRLRVCRSCRGIIDEIGTYRRKPNPNGTMTEVILDKREFHRLDALRYVIAGITGGTVERAPTIWR